MRSASSQKRIQAARKREDGFHPTSIRRILDAAQDCFSERGFHGTTTREIATRAGLSPAALYIHYKSKSQLLQIIIKEAHEEVLFQVVEASKCSESPIDQLRSVAAANASFHATHTTAARVANHELPALTAHQLRPIRDLRQAMEEYVESILRRGMDSGDFCIADLHSTTFAVLSLGMGVSRWFKPKGRLTPQEIGEIYGELALSMVRNR